MPPPPDGWPLEPGRRQMDDMGRAALAFAVEFIEGRSTAPASDSQGIAEAVERLRAPPPENGRPLDELLAVLGATVEKGFDTAGPGYLAYIPGGGLFTAAVGDFLACAVNRFVNIPAPAPAMAQLEASTVRWLGDLFHSPAGSQGVLTSGGSMANFSAVVTARAALLPDDFLSGVLYVSEHAHHSVAKAARLAGFPPSSIRLVRCTPDLRIDVDALAGAIDGDAAAGRRPFLVVTNAGTTNTGTVDPLAEVASVAQGRGLWLHADAAYGGMFQLTERGRARLSGIEAADSITLDPHKGMFLPYGTGCLLVRDGERLRHAHQGEAHYLQDLASDLDVPSFADYSPELSRDFRGLRLWLPLHVHGVGAFRRALDEKLDLARRAYDGLLASPDLEVPWAPDLTVVAFRHRGGDQASRRLLESINASRRVFLSSTTIGGRLTLRICVLSHRTHGERVDEAVQIVTEAARGLR